jgi:ERF superfamily
MSDNPVGTAVPAGAVVTMPANLDSDPLIAMIERVARDPSVNLDRLERLLAQREKAMADGARVAFNTAMAAAQAEMEPVFRDASNPQTRSKYASYGALDNAIREIYSRHGFGVTFDTAKAEQPDHIRVLLFVSRGAHERTYHLDVPVVTKGFKGTDMMTLTHATLSGVTYGRRALLAMAFNIATTDDDGNKAGGSVKGINPFDPISPMQLQHLQQVIAHVGIDIAKVCAFAHVERLEEITVGKYDRVIDGIDAWAARVASAGDNPS